MGNSNYRLVPFPSSREIVIDSGRLAIRRHIIHALIEVDVTQARQFLREHKARTGETISFTAFLISCLAHAVELNPSVQAYRTWHHQLVWFENVDVVTMIEAEKNAVALAHIIRGANTRSLRELHAERGEEH